MTVLTLFEAGHACYISVQNSVKKFKSNVIKKENKNYTLRMAERYNDLVKMCILLCLLFAEVN